MSQLITLGIGTPGTIRGFLLLGLDVVPQGTPWETLVVAADPRAVSVGADAPSLAVAAGDQTQVVGAGSQTLVVLSDPRVKE